MIRWRFQGDHCELDLMGTIVNWIWWVPLWIGFDGYHCELDLMGTVVNWIWWVPLWIEFDGYHCELDLMGVSLWIGFDGYHCELDLMGTIVHWIWWVPLWIGFHGYHCEWNMQAMNLSRISSLIKRIYEYSFTKPFLNNLKLTDKTFLHNIAKKLFTNDWTLALMGRTGYIR